jgi:hypothetical protein
MFDLICPKGIFEPYRPDLAFVTQDWTPLIFSAHPDLAGKCISNPSIVSVKSSGVDDHFLVSYRIYSSWDTSIPCINPDQPGGQWSQGWKGEGGLGLMVSPIYAWHLRY